MTAEEQSRSLELGDELAGYRLEAVLGRGGMGVVYRGWHLTLERPAAVKVIAPAVASQPGFRERFRRESRAAAALEHPNVVPIFDAGEQQHVLYIAMRLIDGSDLAHVLASRGPMGRERAVRIVMQIAAALDVAHDAGLVHRDVKPANVLLDDLGGAERAFLTDFGVSTVSTSAQTLTLPGQVVGTVDYMAPEQIRGEPADRRADVYALGAVFFQMLTGRPPFRGDIDAAVMWAHINETPPNASELAPEVPRSIDTVLASALAKSPADRYGSAGEFAAAARAALEGRAVDAARVAEATTAGVASTAGPVRPDPPPSAPTGLPSGVVTLLAAAVEDATRLMRQLGDEYDTIDAVQEDLLAEVWAADSGSQVATARDALLVAFSKPIQALRAATSAQRALLADPLARRLPMQIAVHTGSPRLRAGGYWGVDVQYAARLCAAARGGQVLVSETTASLIDLPLEDLGEHAVRDFPAPRRVFHLAVDGRGSDHFPPLRALRAGQTNLPAQISSFIGRERELADLRQLLVHGRLVTLTGPGGVGKTRLSLRLGAELLDGSGDGVWFVDLAPVVDSRLVAPTVASSLGAAEQLGQSVPETLAQRLVDRVLLLVIDNCEHVLGPVANLIATLVERCPGVSVLATSREPLGLPGEHIYRVPSLALPDETVQDVERLATSEAVRLFVERARQQRHEFTLDRDNAVLIARLCRRLDGIPLAIELAAVRLRSLSLSDLDARLDQRFSLLRGGSRTLPRQQTLQALIEWSYQLLTPPETQVLEQLSVFTGSFDLSATEIVCRAAGIEPLDVLEHLDALVDKSLLQAEDSSGTARYRLLETIREFAAIKLADHGHPHVARARRAHRDHYLQLAEALHPVLETADRRRALDCMEIEQPNLRAALTESLSDPDPEPGLRLVTALQPFWKARGPSEGAAELGRQLRREDAQSPSLARGRALALAADIYPETLGEYDTAVGYGEEALKIARHHSDDALAVTALTTLAWAHLYRGEFERALAFADEGVSIARALGGARLLSGILGVRGALLATLRRDARPDLEEALYVARATDNRSFIANALSNVGYLELIAGDPSRARAHLEEALAIDSQLDEPGKFVTYATNLGFACYLQDDVAAAARSFAHVIRTADRHNLPSPLATALFGAALTRRPSRASARLRGAAEALMREVGLELDSFEDGLARAHLNRLQSELGGDVVRAEFDAGRGLKRAETIALALDDATLARCDDEGHRRAASDPRAGEKG